MSSDFHVDTEDLRSVSAATDAFADRVTGSGGAVPGAPPYWAASAAAALAADSARQQLALLGGDVAETARRITAAAAAYAEADARAAVRFRLSR